MTAQHETQHETDTARAELERLAVAHPARVWRGSGSAPVASTGPALATRKAVADSAIQSALSLLLANRALYSSRELVAISRRIADVFPR